VASNPSNRFNQHPQAGSSASRGLSAFEFLLGAGVVIGHNLGWDS